jgi:hypothetical protein
MFRELLSRAEPKRMSKYSKEKNILRLLENHWHSSHIFSEMEAHQNLLPKKGNQIK